VAEENDAVKDESSTFGLGREKLARLWEIGEDAPKVREDADSEARKAELLQGQLAESLSLDAGITQILPNIVSVVLDKLKPFLGCSHRHLLTNPETDTSVLETIKNLYKEQAASDSSEVQQEVATVLYYLAIGAALVHADVRITKLSYATLSQSFGVLSKHDWLPEDMKRLLDDAHQCCLRHVNDIEKSDDAKK